MVLDIRCLNIVVKSGTNDQVCTETRGIEPIFVILRHIFHTVPIYSMLKLEHNQDKNGST